MAGESISIESFPRIGKSLSLGDWNDPMLNYLSTDYGGDVADARDSLRFMIRESDLLCLAMSNGYMVVGYGRLEGERLASASVHRDFRRKGIYKELVRIRIGYAIGVLGVTRISVMPTSKTENYFRRLGFECINDGSEVFAFLNIKR